MEVRAPGSDADWEAYFELRWRILRAPWQQSGPQRDESDDVSIHRMVCDANGRVVAVGRLHQVDAATGQIRFMAVDDTEQRKGYGSLLLASLERHALETGLNRIILQAREKALAFYQRHGYRVEQKTFLLFGEIQHYLMSKDLN